ncbi:MAG: acyl carrier protein [Deltaproteobacteria bacterium]|nr:acyl carrier protein [Deltaproteobacteria bacterium]MBN2687023.1 acyl carrier protein [Deltaproteobacteria bacterium]
MKDIVNNERTLHEFLKKMIVETLKLEDISAGDIDSDTPLFREGLGLDSLDALELVVAIEKHFNVIIEDENVGKQAFESIRTLATFIQAEYRQGA